MFELFRVYELAKNEKNKLFRFFCIKYVKHELKYKFFDRYKQSIIDNRIILNQDLLNEFIQFYNCTVNEFKLNTHYAHVITITPNNELVISNNLCNELPYQLVKVKCVNKFNIHVELKDSKCDIAFYLHNETDYDSSITYYNEYRNIANNLVLYSMYNYCVSYVYGNDNNLFIE